MEIKQAKINSPTKRVKRPKQGWHRADIKCQLEKLGITFKALGLEAGYGPRSASRVQVFWWPAIERLVANKLGVEPWEIWPERYNDYGQPVQQGNPNKVKVSRAGRPCNVNVQRAD